MDTLTTTYHSTTSFNNFTNFQTMQFDFPLA